MHPWCLILDTTLKTICVSVRYLPNFNVEVASRHFFGGDGSTIPLQSAQHINNPFSFRIFNYSSNKSITIILLPKLVYQSKHVSNLLYFRKTYVTQSVNSRLGARRSVYVGLGSPNSTQPNAAQFWRPTASVECRFDRDCQWLHSLR